MDKYEASVWHVPPTASGTYIRRIRNGTATLAFLTSPAAVAEGVVRLEAMTDPAAEAVCPANGNGCVDVYAASVPGFLPTARISWPQAAAAARNSLKRLPTNQEWQVAALGTPFGAPCNMVEDDPVPVGSIPGCVSDVGAFDLVGNLAEWVAEWVPRSLSCTFGAPAAPPLFGLGQNCFAGVNNDPSTDGFITAALVRGQGGVYAVSGLRPVGAREPGLGFRAVR